jgi:hypothetical protein
MTAFMTSDIARLVETGDSISLEKPVVLDTRVTFQHYDARYAAPWPLPDTDTVDCTFIGYASGDVSKPTEPPAPPEDPDALPEPLK